MLMHGVGWAGQKRRTEVQGGEWLSDVSNMSEAGGVVYLSEAFLKPALAVHYSSASSFSFCSAFGQVS